MKKILITTIGLILLTAQAVIAQPETDWQKSFDGNTPESDSRINDIIQTADGGYIAVGSGNVSGGDLPIGNIGGHDVLIIKMTASGVLEWSKYWGAEGYDVAYSVIQALDGGYIIAGETASLFGGENNGGYDGFVIKINASGVLQWKKLYGGTGSDEITAIRQNLDGTLIFTGTTSSPQIPDFKGQSDVWLTKLAVDGSIIWEKAKGYSGSEGAGSIEITADGGYILCGYTNAPSASNHHGQKDLWVLKLSALGDIAWQKCIGGSDNEGGGIAIEANDGSIMIFGHSSSNDGDAIGNKGSEDLLLAKLDASGNMVYSKLYGGTQRDWVTRFSGLKQTPDGGFVFLGTSKSGNGDVSGNNGGADFWLVKVNPLGNVEWQQCIGGGGDDFASALALSADGGYLLAGVYNDKNAYIVKMKWNNTGIENLADDGKMNIFPNPSSDVLNIDIKWKKPERSSLTVYDITGRVCILQNLEKAEHANAQIDISQLPAGTYYLKIVNTQGQMSKAFQVVK